MRLFILMIVFSIFSLDVSAQATTFDDQEGDNFESKDSFKPVNKKIFTFNKGVDKVLVKPASQAYAEIPENGREHIGNVLSNLNEPKNFVNGVLQGKPEVAFPSFWRFVINTTMGVGGINDVASAVKLEKKEQGFSDTLGKYGAEHGDYVVLPVVGPSTERNTVGLVGDILLNPVGWVAPTVATAQAPAEGIKTRQEKSAFVDQLYYESMDPYAATRSAYLQNQNHKE